MPLRFKSSGAATLLRLRPCEWIRPIVARDRAGSLRVFGSSLRGEDSEPSDLDLLVDPREDGSLVDLGAIHYQVQKLAGVSVDDLTPAALPESFRDRVIGEAEPL